MAYEHFYQFYDVLMEDIPYDLHVNYIKARLKPSDRILELGCGTGTILIALVKQGYFVDGLDVSEDMLMITSDKLKEQGLRCHLFHDDMSELQIDASYDVIFSSLDSINYLFDEQQVAKTFKAVCNALSKNGTFVFDVHPIAYVDRVFTDYSYHDDRDEFTYLWNTEVETVNSTRILYHDLTFFLKQKEGYYRRLDESHRQLVLSEATYIKLLQDAGFKSIKVDYDFGTHDDPYTVNKLFFTCKNY